MPTLPPLPIDPYRPRITGLLRESPVFLLEAPPGTGKSTRVPLWALDALPDMPQKFPRRLSISFLEEVRPHAEIRSVCEISGNISSHSIFSADTGRECARANVEWASQ